MEAFSALGLGLALAATAQAADIRLVIHGGAGTMAREDFTPERAASTTKASNRLCRRAMPCSNRAIRLVDAVEHLAINQMELNPNFNAGRGAVFTSEGKNENSTRPSWTARRSPPAPLRA